MKLNAEWSLPIWECPDYLSRLSVPEMHQFVKSSRQKLSSIVCKVDISDCFRMAEISPETLLGLQIPDLTAAIMRSTNEQMPTFGEKLHFLYTLRMPLKSVHPFFRDEICLFFWVQKIVRYICKVCFFAMRDRTWLEFLNFLLFSFSFLSGLLRLFWSHLLVLFNGFLLLWRQLFNCLLFDIFLPIIQGPWTFKVFVGSIPKFLTGLFGLATDLLLRFILAGAVQG